MQSKKYVTYPVNSGRRIYNSNDADDITDDNINDKIAKFADQLQSKFVYRIPLRCLCNIGKIYFSVRIDMKIRCTLETETKKLFESNKKVIAMETTDSKHHSYSMNNSC